MKDSWEMKNDFVNLLFGKGYLTEDEHRALLLGTKYNGKRYINVCADRIWFKDDEMSDPFLSIVKGSCKLYITILEKGIIVDSSAKEI